MPFNSPSEKKLLRNIHVAVWVLCVVLLIGTGLAIEAFRGRFSNTKTEAPSPEQAGTPAELIVDGKDVETGLIVADGYLTVKQNCTHCHSSKLITQNHLSRDRWEQTIRWMQKNQNLGDLGENEAVILDYLAANYGPQNTGRRRPLEQPEWYPLE
jgi:hypothetical protein